MPSPLGSGLTCVIDGVRACVAFDLQLNAIEALGHSTFIYASLKTGQDFRIKLDGHHDMGRADHVRIYVRRRDILIFDHQGKALNTCS